MRAFRSGTDDGSRRGDADRSEGIKSDVKCSQYHGVVLCFISGCSWAGV